MRSLRHALWVLAVVLVLQSQPFAFQTPSGSQQSRTTSSAKPGQAKPNCTSNGTYVNSKGQTVQRPENCSEPPEVTQRLRAVNPVTPQDKC